MYRKKRKEKARWHMASKREAAKKVTVTVGEKNIPLNPYIQDVFSGITIALLNTLKHTEDIDDNSQITVTISGS
jgi:hypothetical protein